MSGDDEPQGYRLSSSPPAAAFKNVRAFRDSAAADDTQRIANLLFFASDGSLTWDIAPGSRFSDPNCESILPALAGWEVLQGAPNTKLITDAHNGLARLQIPVAEEHFQAMNELLPIEVWLR